MDGGETSPVAVREFSPVHGPETRRYEAAVNVGGSEQGDAGVPVFVVVPMEESLAVGAGVFDGAEPLGEVRAVFQGLELGLREGIVVGDVGAREWVLVTPRSASSSATGLDFIEEPRSACRGQLP